MGLVIEAAYGVVTPLFCAGADPEHPEIRVASFKGVLRYWWRALAWSRCSGNLSAIQEQEDALFGSAASGQSGVAMRLKPASSPATVHVGQVLKVPRTDWTVGAGARYLGYGVMEASASPEKNTEAGQLTRACLQAPFEFTVQMRGHDLTEQQLASLRAALIALGTLGGMGAKSRKGYGSLVLRSLTVHGEEEWTPPSSIEKLTAQVERLHRGSRKVDGLPEFTALSREARHVLLSSGSKNPVDLLDRVGREMIRFRSSERNFKEDNDLMKMKSCLRDRHPRRIAFGLPHNYGKEDHDQVRPCGDLDRRASPLFIHVHECGGAPVSVLSFLPARFLPKDNSRKSYISVGGCKVPQASEDTLYRPVHEFLDRLLDPRKRKESFTTTVEVRP